MDSAISLNSALRFFLLFFFLFFSRVLRRRQNLLFMRQMSLFTHCSSTVYVLFMGPATTLFKKKLKIGPTVLFTHLKIILLQYFQFQFLVSAKISSIQTDSIGCDVVCLEFCTKLSFLELLSVPVKITTLTTFNNHSVIVWSESQIEYPCTKHY